MPILVFILIFFLPAGAAWALDVRPLVFSPDMTAIHLVDPLYSLDNRQTQWTADSVLAGEHDEAFIQNNRYHLFLGVHDERQPGSHWLRFAVDNQSGSDIALVSSNSTTAHLFRVFLQRYESRAIVRTDPLKPTLQRSREVFAIPPGVWRVYIEVKPDDFLMPVMSLNIMSWRGLLHEAAQHSFLTLSYGICLALMTYNLFLAITIRNRAHFIYIAYNIAILLYYEGRYQLLAEQFGAPEIPTWALTLINSSSLFFFMAFMYHMLGIEKNLRIWRWPMWIMFAFWPFLLADSFIDNASAQIILFYLLIFSGPLSIMVGVHSLIKKVPGARLLLASSILPGVGTFIHFTPRIFGQWLPMGLIECAQLAALDVEMILLSMTIGFKINREQEWLRQKIDHAHAELKTIVYPHQVEQIWNGKSLRQTMPLGEKNAFILVFDVVASSRMQIADPRGFLSKVFQDCSHVMMENYQPEQMVANGYRIKEMGDGFLCSVDFPFACPHANPADHSVLMAHRFLEVFRRHVEALDVSHSIHCSIGIAYGPVEAFYPDSGTQVYDLFGRGIILAHRYESMRDILFRWLKQRDDIVILHRQVFDQLSSELKHEFTEVDLVSSDFKVRDDEGATELYYQLASSRSHRRLLRGA